MYKIQDQITFTTSNVLLQMGIPYNLTGSKYLARAVDIAIHSPCAVTTITKNIYAVIALEFGTKVANVERSIRHAVDTAWNKKKISYLNKLFGIDLYSNQYKPSNSELIALLAERIPYLTHQYITQGAC